MIEAMSTGPENLQGPTPPSQPAPVLDCGPSPRPGLFRRVGPAGPLTILAAIGPAVGGMVLLGTLTLVGPWFKSHAAMGVALYVALVALGAGLAILPTYGCSILGGWAFGFALGFPAVMAALAAACFIGFTLAGRVSGDHLVTLIAERPKWRAVFRGLVGSGFGKALFIITLLRLPPTSPFAVTNVLMAAARVPRAAFVLGTTLGLAPRTAVVVLAAAKLKELNFRELDMDQTWLLIGGAVATVAVIVVIGVLANRALAKFTGAEEADGNPAAAAEDR